MSLTSCPKCGAPAGTGFFCDACGGAMFGDDDLNRSGGVTAQPSMPPPDPSMVHGVPSPDYVSPGDARAAAQAYPPGTGQMPPPGYPLPPGAVAYRPMPRPAPQGLIVSRKAFIIGVSAFLLLILATIGAVYLLKPSPPPRISIPAPPGTEEVTGIFRDMQQDIISESLEDGELDAFYMNMETGDSLIAYHYSSRGYTQVPPEDAGLEEMEAFITENREALEQEFLEEISTGLGVDRSQVEVESITAEETASGDVAVHIEMYTFDQQYGNSAGIDFLAFSKDKTIYFVAVIAANGMASQNIMKHLEETVTFE